jgi:hypothetical protein
MGNLKRTTMKHGFVFYRSWLEAIEELPDALMFELLKAIVYYGLNQEEPAEITPLARSYWKLIKPIIEANNKRYENGKKAKQKQNGSKTEANDKQEGSVRIKEVKKLGIKELTNERIEELKNYRIEEDEAVVELFAMQLSTTKEEVIRLMVYFDNYLKSIDKQHPTITEYKRHFSNWVRHQEVKPLPKKQAWEDPIAYENEVRRKLGKPPVQ